MGAQLVKASADLTWNEYRARRKAMLKGALTPQAMRHLARFDQGGQLVSLMVLVLGAWENGQVDWRKA